MCMKVQLFAVAFGVDHDRLDYAIAAGSCQR